MKVSTLISLKCIFRIGRLVDDLVGVPLVVKRKRPQANSKNRGYDMEAEQAGAACLIHEVKRVGLLIDRYVDLDLRVGDHLVIYISKSQA